MPTAVVRRVGVHITAPAYPIRRRNASGSPANRGAASNMLYVPGGIEWASQNPNPLRPPNGR